MYKFLTKNGQVLALGFGVLMVLIFLGSVLGGLEEFSAMEAEDIANNTRERMGTGIFNFGLMASIAMAILGAAVWLFFGLFQTVTNIKGSLKFIIGLAVLVVVFLVLYNSADGTTTDRWISDFGVTEGISKFVSAALTTTIGLALLTVVIFVLGEVRNLFK